VMTGRPQVYRTTGKCPASHLVSRPYHNGYNALDDYRYRRLVLLVQLRLNSRSPPFRASVQVQTFIIQLLKCVRVLCVSSFIIAQNVLLRYFKH
jgi:hypothetical protein